MDADHNNDARRPVAVVGSGAAGLAAAYRLHQAGRSVRVFEASDYVGGRIRTVRRDGFTFDVGASFLTRSYRSMLDIFDDAGLGADLRPAPSLAGVLRDGTVHRIDGAKRSDALRTRLFSTRSKITLLRAVRDLKRMRAHLSYADLSEAAEFDTETAGAYAERRLNRELIDYLVDVTIRVNTGAPATDVSKIDFFFTLSKSMDGSLLFDDGMSAYPDRLGGLFDVELGATVSSVDRERDGVTVAFRDAHGDERREHFDGCVVATPAPVTPELVPGLDEWRATFLRDVIYSKLALLSVAQSSPLPGEPAFAISIPRAVSEKLTVLFLPHNVAAGRVPEGKGMVQIFAAADWSAELLAEPDDVVEREMLAAAEAVRPGITANAEWCHVQRWDTAVAARPAGYTKDIGEFLRRSRQDTVIQLAGDYASVANLNTASESGERAARALNAALSPPHR